MDFFRNGADFFVRGETALIRLIASVGPLFFVDVIWDAVSLHAWLYITAGIAAFYSLSYFTKKLAWRNFWIILRYGQILWEFQCGYGISLQWSRKIPYHCHYRKILERIRLWIIGYSGSGDAIIKNRSYALRAKKFLRTPLLAKDINAFTI